MGNKYIVEKSLTPTNGNDVLTVVSPSGRRIRPVSCNVVGTGTTSAAQHLEISRSTGGTTGGGAITPNKAEHTDQPSAASVVNTTWSAQPTQDTNTVVIGWNALGGGWKENFPKGLIEARNGENISVRAPSGPTFQACKVTFVFEED